MRWDDDEPSPAPAVPPADEETPAQKLTVQYLFAWVTATSILLALYMAGPGQPKHEHMAMVIGLGFIRFLASLLYGAAFAGWWLVGTGWYRGQMHYPRWPGHWICLIISTKEVLLLITGALVYAVLASLVDSTATNNTQIGPAQFTFIFVPAVASIFAMGGWGVFLAWPNLSISWKVYAGIRLAAECCSVVGALLATFFLSELFPAFGAIVILLPVIIMTGLSCGVAAFIAACVAMIIDIAYGQKRDWLHWLGVIIALAAPMLGMLLWYGAIIGETMRTVEKL